MADELHFIYLEFEDDGDFHYYLKELSQLQDKNVVIINSFITNYDLDISELGILLNITANTGGFIKLVESEYVVDDNFNNSLARANVFVPILKV